MSCSDKGRASLDTREGLQRVLGDRSLYLELLRGLANIEKDTPCRIRQALASGDIDSAKLLAHTLKGLAGSIGAGSVMEAAARLEQALRDGLDGAPLELALTRLDSEITPLMSELARFFEAPPPPTNSAAAPRQLSRICTQLARLLGEDDAEATSCFSQHATQLQAAFPDDFPGLESAIRTFEFTKALTAVQQMQTRLKSDTDRSQTV